MHILLSGIVGSTAYGLAGPGSDIDRLGVFAVPTVALHGLVPPRESVVTTKPDVTYHEARKYAALALSCNPTAIELMWLPDDLYEVRGPLGDELIGIRSAFLSATRVREAFLGYASQQFRRIENRGDGTFSADTRNRTAKHARHLMRLCHQGYELYATGWLPIRLDKPQEYVEFGEAVAAGRLDVARALIARHERLFDSTTSPLPGKPDEQAAENWLRHVRRTYLPDH